jgi:hypothetical protein
LRGLAGARRCWCHRSSRSGQSTRPNTSRCRWSYGISSLGVTLTHTPTRDRSPAHRSSTEHGSVVPINLSLFAPRCRLNLASQNLIFRIFRTGEQSRSRSKSLTPNRPPFRTDAPTVQICGVVVTFALPSCATSARSKSLVTRHRTGQVIPHFRTRSTGRRTERGTHVTSTASTANSVESRRPRRRG